METKLQAVLATDLAGVTVTQLCAELGISRQTFYKYRRRWRAEGPAGLAQRSRAPHRHPQRISVEVEAEIVRLRTTRSTDNGAQMIAYQLRRDGWDPPAVSTIHRVLVGHGLVDAQPQKRPQAATRRFVWPRPNDAWQIDATQWALADGHNVWIMDVLDDHSRMLVTAHACAGPTSHAAVTALTAACDRWGLPAQIMSDNGSCFISTRDYHHTHRPFAGHLNQLGIRHIRATPGHPQTCGKLERHHHTMKRWLASHPTATNLHQLQHQLNTWTAYYNQQRPHSALAGATPHHTWHATRAAQPHPTPATATTATVRTVTKAGVINYHKHTIRIGAAYTGTNLVLIHNPTTDTITIHGPHGPVRTITLTPGQRSYPTGNPPGGPRKPRLTTNQ